MTVTGAPHDSERMSNYLIFQYYSHNPGLPQILTSFQDLKTVMQHHYEPHFQAQEFKLLNLMSDSWCFPNYPKSEFIRNN